MNINKGVPVTKMVVKYRISQGAIDTQEYGLSRRVNESTVFVLGPRSSQPDYVIDSFYSLGHEGDPEQRLGPSSSTIVPKSEYLILVSFVAKYFIANRLFAMRIKWLSTVVDFEEDVENALRMRELEMAIGLLPVLPYIQR